MEKDINIEDKDQLNEEQVSKTAETPEGVDDNETTQQPQEETDSQDEPKSECDQLKEQLELLNDKYLRTMAEFDNYRKRTIKERADLIINGGEKVITALLPVIDDMERAQQNGEKTDDPQVLREGMDLICQKLMKVLQSQGLSIIDTKDADFDTELHEAVALVPGMGDDKKGKVIDCMSKGYKLNDKVIRYAKVAVGQ